MSIGTLFLITILIVIGVWLFRIYKRARKLYRMVFYGEMPGNDSRDSRNQNRSQNRTKQKKNNRKSKLFTSEDGEYVEFEEISGTTSHTSTSHTGTTYTTEEQVEDVEWEDIKP